MKIDAHHHFWKYDPVEYDWIDDKMRAIRRDFLPEDLRSEIEAARLDGVVSVQARQALEETSWLLKMARANDFIRGVVGWVPLISDSVAGELERFAAEPKFKAVRHVLQGEPDDNYMLREDFNRGIRALKPLGLVYDILVFERHLPQTIELVDRHPEQVFVLDHIAKPRIADGVFEPWNRNIRELAKRENVFCKLSGMVTEAAWPEWTETQLRPYAETVLEAFGARRTMFGSDWPVCLVATGYAQWISQVRRFASECSADEQDWLLGKTATHVYHLAD
ncbi:MAG: amidohydrolase family protein [Chthoniobacterales bacterium]